MKATDLITTERNRQIMAEGYSAEHDDIHDNGEILSAAIAYAETARQNDYAFVRTMYWPWSARSFKPKDKISNLVKAGALIAAEIDRLQRASK